MYLSFWHNAAMKVIVTGTVGLDKCPYLESVKQQALDDGQSLELCHIGNRMYAEAPDVAPGRILDLPMQRLNSLRRSVFKDVLAISREHENVIVNTHATFRWKHGLFPAFDFDMLREFNADYYICLLDNVDALHSRLVRDHIIDHSLKDLMVWREEEILATELMMLGSDTRSVAAGSVGGATLFDSSKGNSAHDAARFYIHAIGHYKDGGMDDTTAMLYRLLFKPAIPKAYLSFPMTHVADNTAILEEIEQFRRRLSEIFVIFDPADVDEHRLCQTALDAARDGRKVMNVGVLGQKVQFDVADVLQVAGDIHSQIYARDFMMIDQADMIVSYIPEMEGGKPGLSSGVERELQHAYEATRDVYVIWKPKMTPSPFITETATKVFTSIQEAMDYFTQKAI